jgi:hypothetical protein
MLAAFCERRNACQCQCQCQSHCLVSAALVFDSVVVVASSAVIVNPPLKLDGVNLAQLSKFLGHNGINVQVSKSSMLK